MCSNDAYTCKHEMGVCQRIVKEFSFSWIANDWQKKRIYHYGMIYSSLLIAPLIKSRKGSMYGSIVQPKGIQERDKKNQNSVHYCMIEALLLLFLQALNITLVKKELKVPLCLLSA